MRDQKLLLEDMLTSIEIMEQELKGATKEIFKEKIALQDIAIRRFAIVGEASKKLSKDLKDKHKEVNWKEVAGMRDFLVHEYFEIKMDIVWKAFEIDLPVLKKAVKEMIEEVK